MLGDVGPVRYRPGAHARPMRRTNSGTRTWQRRWVPARLGITSPPVLAVGLSEFGGGQWGVSSLWGVGTVRDWAGAP